MSRATGPRVLRSLLVLILAVTACSGQDPQLDNGLLRITFNKPTRTWVLAEHAGRGLRTIFSNATASALLADSSLAGLLKGEVTTRTDVHADALGNGRRLDVKVRTAKLEWLLSLVLYDGRKVGSVAARLTNVSKEPLRFTELRLLDLRDGGHLQCQTDNVLMHVNGYQSWSTSEVVKCDASSAPTSHWSTVIAEPDAFSSLLLGFVTNTASMNSIAAWAFSPERGEMHCSARGDLRTLELAPGGVFSSDRLVVAFDASPMALLRQYGEWLQLLAPVVNKPITPPGRAVAAQAATVEVPSGWCSWYYYYQHISEDSILQNLRFASEHLREAGLRYIQIDDGFQIAAGDWNTNANFPHGHRWMTDQIHAAGFRAGLWVAPFAVAESSSVYRQHRDWLLRKADGTLAEFFANDWWGGRIYSLDPTHPRVQAWLEQLFDVIVNEWKYDYVKIDFLYFAADGGRYHRPVTSARAYELGMKAIRKGVGSDKFILGCGAPLGPSIGYVDGMRIGGDVYAAWGGVTPGVNAAAQRFFYHGNVWLDDPDCLVVREPLTIDQARVWASIVALSGQMNLLSDKLAALPAERVDLLRMTLPTTGVPGAPVELFTAPPDGGLALVSGDSTLKLPPVWKFTTGDSPEWKEPAADDAGWSPMPVPSRWESEGFPDYDGVVWYRIRFTVPAAWPRAPVRLSLGKIDDCDEAYLNGVLIGSTGQFPPAYTSEWTSFRTYELPESVLVRGGENVLAVRVYDGGGPGGIYSTKAFHLPTIWGATVERSFATWKVAGVYNWSSDERTVAVRAADFGLPGSKTYLVYEYWSQAYLGELTSSMELRLAPTSGKVLTLHEKRDVPVILSTSRHILQGAVDLSSVTWDSVSTTLSVVSDKLLEGEYSAVVYLPEHLRPDRVVGAPQAAIEPIAERVVRVSWHVAEPGGRAWKLRCVKR